LSGSARSRQRTNPQLRAGVSRPVEVLPRHPMKRRRRRSRILGAKGGMNTDVFNFVLR
jgi:hypothetical protein